LTPASCTLCTGCAALQKEENAATMEEIVQERQYQVDAALVRIMKTRKTMNYQVLLAELFAQLKFPAKVWSPCGYRVAPRCLCMAGWACVCVCGWWFWGCGGVAGLDWLAAAPVPTVPVAGARAPIVTPPLVSLRTSRSGSKA
jgi:hypothetical protein